MKSRPPAGLPPAIVNLHRKNNRASATLWTDFADHRARVTALALAAADPARTLAVLGAGNCNDLGLPALTAHFREVHLVDVDEEALVRARDGQPAEVAQKLILHAPVDLSGTFGRLGEFRGKPPTPAQLGLLPSKSVANVLLALPQRFDVVLSACLLSQLMHSCFIALGPKHPHLHLVACAMAVAHLRSLVSLTAPGGTGIVVTDALSSETFALEELWDESDPGALLEELGEADRTFSGTAPSFLRNILGADPIVAPLITTPQQLPPWLWRFSASITYLVYGFVFTTRR